MNHTAFVRCALFSVAIALATSSCAEDWYRWRGPNENDVSNEHDWDHRRIGDGDAILWRRSVGVGFCSVVTRNQLLYTVGNQDQHDTIFCLDTASGDVVWKHTYPSPLDDREFAGGPTSTPTIDEDRVYSLSREGDLFCLNARSGEVVWQAQVADLADVRVPGWGFSASPVVSGETLLINAGDAGVALNKMTGDLIWKSSDKDSGYGTPTLVQQQGRTLAIIPSGRSYVAVDIATGKEQWRQRWLTSFGCNAADPIVDGNRVFLCSGYNRGAALLQVTDGDVEVVWKNKDMQNQISSSILIDGFLYGVDGDVDKGARLTCMDFQPGEVCWSDEALLPGAIAATSQQLIVVTAAGELVIAEASPQLLKILARTQVLNGKSWTKPVLSNGKIYCRSAGGELVCLDVAAKAK